MAPKLKITIIGAGLAGTICGRVLREQHDVIILERFSGGHEVGAAINLGPSATKIIQSLGFDKNRAGSIEVGTTRTFNKDGRLLQERDVSDCPTVYGAAWMFQHRADLWNEFLRLASAPSDELGVEGNPAKILWGVEVTNVDVERGDVTLEDGRVIASDLVIGADGIKSLVRPLVVGDEAFKSAHPSGSSAFRFTLPASVVKEVDPNSRTMDPTKLATLDVQIAMDGTNRSIICYPCRNFELLNFVCITPDSYLDKPTTESWAAVGEREDLLRVYSDFGPAIKKLLQRAEDIKLWQLRDQDPLPSYIKGRTVLIGDAAHAMTPHQGQGGTQAVEDAEGFVLFNGEHIDRNSVPTVLQDFDRVRRTRASRIQNHTREAHERKTPEGIYKDTKYNWTYPGVRESLKRLNAGAEMIPI